MLAQVSPAISSIMSTYVSYDMYSPFTEAISVSYTHLAPVVSAAASADTITLSWEPVAKAVEYQIFEYYEETGLLYMLDITTDTSITIENLEQGVTYRSVSYTHLDVYKRQAYIAYMNILRLRLKNSFVVPIKIKPTGLPSMLAT